MTPTTTLQPGEVQIQSAGRLDLVDVASPRKSSAYGQPRGIRIRFVGEDVTYVSRGGYADSATPLADEDVLIPAPDLQSELDAWDRASADDLLSFEEDLRQGPAA